MENEAQDKWGGLDDSEWHGVWSDWLSEVLHKLKTARDLVTGAPLGYAITLSREASMYAARMKIPHNCIPADDAKLAVIMNYLNLAAQMIDEASKRYKWLSVTLMDENGVPKKHVCPNRLFEPLNYEDQQAYDKACGVGK